MPQQAATITSLPEAFAVMKAMLRVLTGSGRRSAAAAPVAEGREEKAPA